MDYETKIQDGNLYQVRFATFRPKTFEEAAKAMELSNDDKNNDAITRAFKNGIRVECLVPVANSISDMEDLLNVYSEDYLVSCFVHGIAIKEQAKSRQTLECLARPKSGKINNAKYNKLFNKITAERMQEIMSSDNPANDLQLEIQKLNIDL